MTMILMLVVMVLLMVMMGNTPVEDLWVGVCGCLWVMMMMGNAVEGRVSVGGWRLWRC